MIEMRRAQRSFGDGLIAEEVGDLREDWMKHADQVLEDEQLVAAVYEALAKRHPKSRSRGRLGAPAEVVLRLLILKHVRNWSYEVLEREVRANLVYRDFTRVGGAKSARRQDHGPLGLGGGAGGGQTDSRKNGEDCPKTKGWRKVGACAWTPRWWRPISTIRPTAACWGRGAGADPDDEEDHRDRG